MIPVPHGRAYLMPVARVMKLYRHHIGSHAVAVSACPPDLDVVASRTDQTLYLHVVNTHRTRATETHLQLNEGQIETVKAFQIADDPMVEVSEFNSADVMKIEERELAVNGPWRFPAASVSAIEIQLAA
jgi:alpha-L-arabinofuranosidase